MTKLNKNKMPVMDARTGIFEKANPMIRLQQLRLPDLEFPPDL